MEARLEQTDEGLVPQGDGWFVMNARDARWYFADGRPPMCRFEGEDGFPQLGINLQLLGPGQPQAMYHWEEDQEDFLVLAGEGVLIVEGEERPLRQWDFFHCPRGTKHVIVGGPCLVLSVGARDRSTGEDWGGYSVDPLAARYGASVEEDTPDETIAYADWNWRKPSRYRDGWLPQDTR